MRYKKTRQSGKTQQIVDSSEIMTMKTPFFLSKQKTQSQFTMSRYLILLQNVLQVEHIFYIKNIILYICYKNKIIKSS